MKKRIMSLVLALVMCMGLAVPALAASESGFYNAAENVQVFLKVFEADSVEANIIKMSVSHADTGGNVSCTAGSAFAVYNFDTDIVFYMVPIFSGEECIGTVHMSQDLDVGAVWTSDTTLYEKVFDLPGGNYIIYVVGGVFYAESSERIVLLEDTGFSLPSNDTYFSIPYAEKVENFLSPSGDTCTLSSICALQDQAYDISLGSEVLSATNQPYVVVPEYETGTCNITNFVLQGNRPLCWAACIATIVNYKKGKNLSASDVAKGASKPNQAALDEATTALNSYGFSYNGSWNKIAWTSVKNNIKNKNPFIVGFETYDKYGNRQRHMVTAYSYMCRYGDQEELSHERYVYTWDPYSNERVSFQYYESANVLMDGYYWNWTASIAP